MRIYNKDMVINKQVKNKINLILKQKYGLNP